MAEIPGVPIDVPLSGSDLIDGITGGGGDIGDKLGNGVGGLISGDMIASLLAGFTGLITGPLAEISLTVALVVASLALIDRGVRRLVLRSETGQAVLGVASSAAKKGI